MPTIYCSTETVFSHLDNAFFHKHAALILSSRLVLLAGDGAVAAERTRCAELAKTMANHVVRYEHIVEYLAVMNRERVADKIGHDHGTTGPRLDGGLFVLGVQGVHLLLQVFINKRPFLD